MENSEIGKPSLVAMFDDYTRRVKILLQNDYSQEFLLFVKHQEECRLKWKESVLECKRLKNELDNANKKISDFEKKLNRARLLLDSEKRATIRAESERDELRDQVAQIDEILSSVRRAGNQLANETKEKLDKFLSMTHSKIQPSGDYAGCRLDTIDEINSTERKRVPDINASCTSIHSTSWSSCTGSLLSDISYTRSEDNIDVDLYASFSERGTFKKPRRSSSPTEGEGPAKKRRSVRIQNKRDKIQKTTTDHLVATTTVTVPKEGPVTASSTIKTYPEPGNNPTLSRNYLKPTAPPITPSDTESEVSEAINYAHASSPNLCPNNRLFTRPHCFKDKMILKPSEECGGCSKKLTFGSKMSFCGDCKTWAHNKPDCRDKVPRPCIAIVETPRRGNTCATISDYCGKNSPMIPPFIVHAVMEVESRGVNGNEVGIYRIPGSESVVRFLKERFIRGKCVSLSEYDIHAVCGAIKAFLGSLSEPLITFSLLPEFIRASEEEDPTDRTYAFYQVISQLPQPNRDTLAFIMQHLQKVAEHPDCKMPATSLATVFGPTIVGSPRNEPVRNDICADAMNQAMAKAEQKNQVVKRLLDIPGDYWNNFVNDVNRETGSLGYFPK